MHALSVVCLQDEGGKTGEGKRKRKGGRKTAVSALGRWISKLILYYTMQNCLGYI
jgi:hypothetical protein